MACGRARSVTRRSPRARCARIRRRVGSARAANVPFSVLEYLTIWLTISSAIASAQTFFYYLQDPADRAGRSNNRPCAHRQQRPEEQRLNRKMQVIFAREKIAGELENKPPTCRSRSFHFRDLPLNCEYAH